jgi:hypothetical protein
LVVAKGRVKRKLQSDTNVYGVFFFLHDENALELDSDDGYTICEYSSPPLSVVSFSSVSATYSKAQFGNIKWKILEIILKF